MSLYHNKEKKHDYFTDIGFITTKTKDIESKRNILAVDMHLI